MKLTSHTHPAALMRIAAVFKSLAHSGRLRILNALRQRPMSISELATATSLPRAEVSTHAHLLAHVGLLSLSRNGNRVICLANRPLVQPLWHLAGLSHLTTEPPGATLMNPFDPEI